MTNSHLLAYYSIVTYTIPKWNIGGHYHDGSRR